MADLLTHLKQWVILSYQEIITIKHQLAETHAGSDSSIRAQLLAERVHHVLNQHLKGMTETEKQHIRRDLLKKCIVNSQRDIYQLDVLEAICDMEPTVETRLERSKVWLKANTDLSITDEDITAYLESLTPSQIIAVPSVKSSIDDKIDENDEKNIQFHITSLIRLRFRTVPFAKVLVLAVSILMITRVTALNAGQELQINSPSQHQNPSSTIGTPHTAQLITPLAPHLEIIKAVKMQSKQVIAINYKTIHNPYLPENAPYSYRPIDYLALRNYLRVERNSYLVNESFLNEIIVLAKVNDLDPLLLLAIIGQEQGFIPETSTAKHRIVNNPYNVFSSWQHYNTSLNDTTIIAINLIQDRLTLMPADADAFEWLNIIYAEDPNWSSGVSSLYDTLSQYRLNL